MQSASNTLIDTTVTKENLSFEKVSIKLLEGDDVLKLCMEAGFQERWDSLYKTCPWATIFQSRLFVVTWYKIYQNDFMPILVKQESESKLVGLLTMAKDKNGKLIGAGANQADYQSWLGTVDNGFIQNALLAVYNKFNGSSIQLKYINSNVPLEWILTHPVLRKRCFIKEMKHSYFTINNEVVNSRLRKPSRRNKINRLKSLGELKFEHIKDGEAFAVIIDEVAFQSDFRKGAMYNKFYFRDDPLKIKFLMALLQHGVVHATVLKLNDKIIASNIGTSGKDQLVMHSGINSHNPSYAKFSPGILHFLYLGKYLNDEGVQILDLGPGDDAYKEEIASDFAQLRELYVDSAFQISLYKAKAALIGFTKKLTALLGIQLDVLRRARNTVRKGGIFWFIKMFERRNGRRINRYLLTTDTFPNTSTLHLNIRKGSLCDLLDFKVNPRQRLTRWSFLSDAMVRLELGDQCYTWSEEGVLLCCVWLHRFGLSEINGDKAGDHKHQAILLQGLYCHASAVNNMESFLKIVVNGFNDEKVYAETADPAFKSILISTGFTPSN